MPINYRELGRVKPRTPILEDPSLLHNYILENNARNKEAIDQMTKITAAINELDLNPAEDQWKRDYINNINTQIEEAASFGNYSTALNKARLLAKDVLDSPAITGRLKANQEYNRIKEGILNRNDIDQVTKDRWLAENQYSYNDKFDDNGNIIGGTEWKSNWTPVSKINLDNVLSNAKSFLAEEQGYTKDPATGEYIGSYRNMPYSKLKQNFDDILRRNGAYDYVYQSIADKAWQLNQYETELDNLDPSNVNKKLELENKIKTLKDDITDSNGTILYNPGEYLYNMTNNTLKNMSYNYSTPITTKPVRNDKDIINSDGVGTQTFTDLMGNFSSPRPGANIYTNGKNVSNNGYGSSFPDFVF